MTDRIQSDEHFAIVPNWVQARTTMSRAIHLYVVLSKFADADRVAFPGRPLLAELCGCSVSTVDRAIAELERIDALTKTPRKTERGDHTTNLYTLHRIPPSKEAEAIRTGAAG